MMELSAAYANVMLGPRAGRDVCPDCFDLLGNGHRCPHCTPDPAWLDAMAPISYSVGGEQMHHALCWYKSHLAPPAHHFSMGLASVLWRHVADHEACLARAAGVDAFELVAVVPSSDARRDATHPLHRLAGDLVEPLRARYARLLRRTDVPVRPHRFHAERYEAAMDVRGRTVLLIDDTWTTGANARSAAAALKVAGAERVGGVVIGRYVNRGWRQNDRQLRGLPQPFDWDCCARCGENGGGA
jgi:predicted amidophosphoribosyltransferase